MSTARKVLGGGSLYTVATVAPILALLAVTPLVTTFLGSTGYGQVAVAISVCQVGSVLFALGLPTMVTRDALLKNQGFHFAVGYVVVGSGIAIALSGLAALTAWLWAPALFPGVPTIVVVFALIAGAGLAVVTLGQAILRAAERITTFVVVAIVSAVLPPLTGLGLLASVSQSPALYVAGLASGYAAVAVASVVIAVRHRRPSFDIAAVSRAVGIGLPTVPHGLAVPALLSVAISIATHTDGVALAGQLQLAVMLGTAGITVLNALNNAWAPMIFKAPAHDRPAVLSESTFLVSFVSLALIAGYAVVAPFVVPFVGRSIAGDSTTQASMLIAVAGSFMVPYLANIHLTFIAGRTLPLALLTPLSAVISTVAGYALAVRFPGDLFAFAVIWPIFYACQAVFAYVLAKVGPFVPVRLGSSCVILAMGVVLGWQAAVIEPQPLWSIACVVVAAPIAALVWSIRRRRHARAVESAARTIGTSDSEISSTPK